ncbi:MAG: sigma-70 family RNA polymerase sigma factor [Planctomycetota bacterium]|nr:MAG: sigma-70 family RNA polymerase sigma factor [Planctomycetota bacterium]
MGQPALRLVHRQDPPSVSAAEAAEGLASLSDEELLALSCAGEKEAFRVLVERYQDRAVHTARAVVGNLETAREVAQEAFLKVYAHRDRFDIKRRFSSWFYRILRNLAVDRLRRQAAGTPGAASELVGDWDGSFRSPEAEASLQERKEAVHRVLQDLPGKFREVLWLRDIEGLPCAEIGRRVGISAGTVRWRLHHARKLFRQHWERLHGPEQGDAEL